MSCKTHNSFLKYYLPAWLILLIVATEAITTSRNPHLIGLNSSETSAFTQNQQFHTNEDVTNNTDGLRKPKFLSKLFNSDALNCMPQVMCELISAKEPGTKTGTLNDYKYVIKEFFLKSERDSDEVEESDYKQNNKIRANWGKTKKAKPTRVKNEDNSSPEDDSSVSLSSKEVKINEMAALMDLEEQDQIEDKAVHDMIDGDPEDFAFAMADMKNKQRLKQVAINRLNNPFNGIRYARNLVTLRRFLNQNDHQTVFRTSRAIKDAFLERKAQELKKTQNNIDRVRIAAEVAQSTRNARQCRALFDSCSINSKGIQTAANNLRKKISGESRSDQENEVISTNRIRTLISEVQQQQQQPTDVKVVLHIGGQPNTYQPVTNYWSGNAITTTTSTPIPSTITTKTMLSLHSEKPKIHYFPTIKDEYKLKLQEASKLLTKIPTAFPTNFNTRLSPLHETAYDKPRLLSDGNGKRVKKVIDPGDSISIESSEEFEPEYYPVPLPQFRSNIGFPYPVTLGPIRVKRILASIPDSSIRRPPQQIQRPSSSWLSNIFDMLFNDKEVAPLPQTLDQWIPSAQRHGIAQASEPWSFLRFPNSLWSFPPGRPPHFPMPQKNNIPVRLHHRQGELKASPSAVKIRQRKKKLEIKSSKVKATKNKKRRKEFNYKKCCTNNFVRRPH